MSYTYKIYKKIKVVIYYKVGWFSRTLNSQQLFSIMQAFCTFYFFVVDTYAID